jgi:hypothetical protein
MANLDLVPDGDLLGRGQIHPARNATTGSTRGARRWDLAPSPSSWLPLKGISPEGLRA